MAGRRGMKSCTAIKSCDGKCSRCRFGCCSDIPPYVEPKKKAKAKSRHSLGKMSAHHLKNGHLAAKSHGAGEAHHGR